MASLATNQPRLTWDVAEGSKYRRTRWLKMFFLQQGLTRAAPAASRACVPPLVSCASTVGTIFAPQESHAALRTYVRDFVKAEVEPQALVHNREEKFNYPLFRRAGELGLLGMTVEETYGAWVALTRLPTAARVPLALPCAILS